MPRKKIRGHRDGPIDGMMRTVLSNLPSIQQLAESANTTPSLVRRFIRRENTLTIESADRLLRALYGDSAYLIIRVGALDDARGCARTSSVTE